MPSLRHLLATAALLVLAACGADTATQPGSHNPEPPLSPLRAFVNWGKQQYPARKYMVLSATTAAATSGSCRTRRPPAGRSCRSTDS